jgi:hypothetical protein
MWHSSLRALPDLGWVQSGSGPAAEARAPERDLRGRCRAEPSQVMTGLGQTSGVEHGAKERARL